MGTIYISVARYSLSAHSVITQLVSLFICEKIFFGVAGTLYRDMTVTRCA